VFDISPRQYVASMPTGKLEAFLDMAKGPVHAEISDLSITTDGKLAYSHSMQHLYGTNADGSRWNSMRASRLLSQVDGKWLVTSSPSRFRSTWLRQG